MESMGNLKELKFITTEMIFSSKDCKYSFSIENSLVQEILGHVKKSGKKETGGILIGNYSSDRSTAFLKKITGPPSDSRHGDTWFERGIKGLQKILNTSWLNQEYYLGEWHFHPLAAPNPSYQDIRQMRDISNSNSYQCPEPILLIIGGDFVKYEINVFVAISNAEVIELKKNTNLSGVSTSEKV